MSEAHDRAQAKAKIARTEWFGYVSAFVAVNIERSLIPIAAEHVKSGNWMDACAFIGQFAKTHLNRLREAEIDFSQSEGILPFGAEWHVLLIDEKVYVSDTEFFPYPASWKAAHPGIIEKEE